MKRNITVILCLCCAYAAWADSDPPSSAPTTTAGMPLGQRFESKAAGIAFSAPADMRKIKLPTLDPEIVHYLNEERSWILKVARQTLPQPLPLSTTAEAGKETIGILESILTQTKTSTPGAQVLRNDVVAIGPYKVGMLALRYTIGIDRKLTQLAIVQADQRLYYIFNLTTPGGKTSTEELDPEELLATQTLRAILESLQILDRSQIAADQEQRLFRTRALFAQLAAKDRLNNILIPEQWLRLQRDGKDIGYSYLTQRPEVRGNADGILFAMRSVTYPDKTSRVEAETWQFCSLDRKHESWTNAAIIDTTRNGKTSQDYISEFGSSDQSPKSYALTVKYTTRRTDEQMVRRDLPPWYLPQALGHLLPRLLPLNEPKTYLFASYVTEQREVISRYVDVLKEQEIQFDGQKIRAVPIEDRIGLEGTITTHYMSPEGRYLGSETLLEEEQDEGRSPTTSRITMLPTDAQTLNQLWKDAKLTVPQSPAESNRPK